MASYKQGDCMQASIQDNRDMFDHSVLNPSVLKIELVTCGGLRAYMVAQWLLL